MSLVTEQDCEDFVVGCLFMGTGGGGDPAEGLDLLRDALHAGLELGWVSAESIEDDTLTVTTFGNGSIAPEDPAAISALRKSLYLGEPARFEDTMQQAVIALGDFLDAPVGCIVAAELGASNCPAPIVTGARLDIPVVDGDYSGRAVPDEMGSTPFIHGVMSHPFASVDLWGNVAIVTETANPYMFERVAKMLGIAGIHGNAIAATPISGKLMKRVIVPGTLSNCLRIGRAIRNATVVGEDPVDAALEVAGGWRLFEGVVAAKSWQDRDGYMTGTLDIECAASSGLELRIWFKNENHISWLNGKPWVCSPDLITLVDPSSAHGYTSTTIEVGDRVSAVEMRGLDVFRSADGLKRGLGPPHFGFGDIEYVPIEDLM